MKYIQGQRVVKDEFPFLVIQKLIKEFIGVYHNDTNKAKNGLYILCSPLLSMEQVDKIINCEISSVIIVYRIMAIKIECHNRRLENKYITTHLHRTIRALKDNGIKVPPAPLRPDV